MRQFIVARNPEAASALPFLLCIPVGSESLWLKAREPWPRDSRVYCHPVRGVPSIAELAVLERVDVLVCRRNGRAIDMVLARKTNRRSQFILASSRGRQIILWQSARSVRAARPGLRIPGSTSEVALLYVDTRERHGYTFRSHHVALQRQALIAGDYAVMVDERVVGVVERKRIADFISSLSDGSLNFAMAELAVLPFAAVAVEGTYSTLLRHPFTRNGFLPALLARLQVRYPQIAINFLETRKVAEEWTYRYLAGVYSHTMPASGKSRGDELL